MVTATAELLLDKIQKQESFILVVVPSSGVEILMYKLVSIGYTEVSALGQGMKEKLQVAYYTAPLHKVKIPVLEVTKEVLHEVYQAM